MSVNSDDQPAFRRAYLDWQCADLLEVPPVEVVTHEPVIAYRQNVARFIDGRHVNDAIYRAVLALRREFGLESGPYVVVFPQYRFEIPLDLRPIDGEGGLAAVAYLPRSTTRTSVDLTSLEQELAGELRRLPRDAVIQRLKTFDPDGTIELPDICGSAVFVHRFAGRAYRHSYRYVAAGIPELDR